MQSAEGLIRFEELRAQSQRLLIAFVNGEIQLGFTFAESAAMERDLGNIQHYQQAKRHLEEAVTTIRRFLNRIANTETRTAAANGCAELERALAAL
ncbi:MAG TPA: hypothetical protein VK638_37845 [Edaphobacter sp.]|nr:hypothetical protein [Edaphobacter sp.]